MSENENHAKWDDCAETYDRYYEKFEGAVEDRVDRELIKKYLPEDKNARILDAAGGTGRIALPLAQQGYAVTLCDKSSKMLEVASRKMYKHGVSNRVEIMLCDVRELPYDDATFDFALCWNGTADATRELTRVTKKGGRLSLFLVSTWATAIRRFHEDPAFALQMIESPPCHLEEEGCRHWAVGPEEVTDFFGAMGIRVLDLFAVCGWLDFLRLPEELVSSRDWDKKLFEQTVRMVLRLCKERSVKGLTRHLVMYGEKL